MVQYTLSQYSRQPSPFPPLPPFLVVVVKSELLSLLALEGCERRRGGKTKWMRSGLAGGATGGRGG